MTNYNEIIYIDRDELGRTGSTVELQEFSEGDYVEHGEFGQGVIVSVMDESFEFPTESTEDPDMTTVDASSDDMTYVVALMSGGLSTASGDELDGIGGLNGDGVDVTDPDEAASNIDNAELGSWYANKSSEELVRLPGVDDPGIGWDGLPDGWTRKSVLQAYASLGGTWRSGYAKMLTHFGPFAAKRLISSLKDEVYGTTHWRNRF